MIDIIIPAYNCSKTIHKTLSSLVSQTDNDFNVIVIDDCSSENINEIIEYFNKYLNITVIRNKNNIGCGMSRQKGIDYSSNPFFCFLDSDDVFMPYTVETFNSIINSNPNVELVHSWFYEQTYISGNPALVLRKDGFTWCHGKLYNRRKIEELGIKNSPIVKWADDSYYNSMCMELMNTCEVSIPMYLWCNNPNSVIRSKNEYRDKNVQFDFLRAMVMSADFVYNKKGYVDFIKPTLKKISSYKINSEEEQKLKNELISYLKEE